MLRDTFTHKKGSKAQAMVEFALTLPILMVLIVGVFEAGRLLFYYVAVNTASRDAARYGATVGTTGGTPHYYDCDGITTLAESRGFIADISTVTIEYDTGPQANGVNPATFGACADQPELGDGVRIVVTAQSVFTPVVKEIGGIRIFDDITVSSTSYRTIMSRTYLPDQVSYESSSSSGSSTSSGGGGSSTSSGGGGSSSSSAAHACVFQIIQPDDNLNLSVLDATWKFRNVEPTSVNLTSVQIISGDPANPNKPALVKEVYLGGSNVYLNVNGELNVTVNGSWQALPNGGNIPIRIVYTNGIKLKNVTINVTINGLPDCQYPLP